MWHIACCSFRDIEPETEVCGLLWCVIGAYALELYRRFRDSIQQKVIRQHVFASTYSFSYCFFVFVIKTYFKLKRNDREEKQ